tara:strand:- start:486 stop:716 length:231 start_codon:yes stop_codon:yes gene_type:complete
MRKYTYTLKEERKYVVGIDAESEQEADKILDRMGKKGVEKHLTEIVWSDIISVSKGDFFETPKKKAKKKTTKKTKK